MLTRRLIVAALFCWFTAGVGAAEITVVTPGETALTREFTESLRERRPDDRIQVIPVPSAAEPLAPTDLIVTLGQAGLAWRLQTDIDTPTVAAYVTTSSLPTDMPLPDDLQILLASPKPERQLALARALLPRLSSISLLHSPEAALRLELWKHAAAALGLSIATAELEDATQLASLVAKVLEASDVLIGTDDPAVYNADTLKTILLTSYARNKVLIGPSAPFIAAGSLSTTFSTPAQMAESVDRLLDASRTTSTPIHYPDSFSVLSNHQVARSLGLPIPDDERLARELNEQEQKP